MEVGVECTQDIAWLQWFFNKVLSDMKAEVRVNPKCIMVDDVSAN